MNFPGGETAWGETVGGVNHPGGESSVGVKKNFYKGVNRPGVNDERGETSAIQKYTISYCVTFREKYRYRYVIK